MRKVLIILLSLFAFISLAIGFLFVINLFNGDAISNNVEPNKTGNEVVNNEPKLTCFEFIDQQFQADGYTYLEEGKWGRGNNNSFIVDVLLKEFQMAQWYAMNMVPTDWYKDYESNVYWIYNHQDKKIYNGFYLYSGGKKTDEVAAILYDPSNVKGTLYDLPIWMDYYINQTNKYGCSIEDLTVEKLTGEYKTLKSTATKSDVVSVFDRKSEDGVLRYFADVHIEGNIEDNPRYEELETKEEYYALDTAVNFEQYYLINVLYHNPENYLMFPDLGGIESSVLKEFVKDVVYPNSSWKGDNPKADSIGIYFIYVDNPNGEFEFMYQKPVDNNGSGYSLEKFDTIHTPFEGFVMLVNKMQGKDGRIYEEGPKNIYYGLEAYLLRLKDFNPKFEYSEDFITNYSRPFNKEWQKMMGLTQFFDEKYGFVNHEIKYKWE